MFLCLLIYCNYFLADVSATPFGLNSLGGLVGLESLGLGQGSFMDLQARMQNELMTNPDMLRNVLDNPLVQQLMNDPENMRTLITSNPQMQDLMQVNIIINPMDLMVLLLLYLILYKSSFLFSFHAVQTSLHIHFR